MATLLHHQVAAMDLTSETQDKGPTEATHRMAGLRQLRFLGSTKQNTRVPGPLSHGSTDGEAESRRGHWQPASVDAVARGLNHEMASFGRQGQCNACC